MKMNYKINKQYRLPHYDYSTTGYYFVTLCTRNHVCHMGRIEEEKIVMNSIGKIATEVWENIPNIYELVGIDEFIVMPNHIHGIVIIRENYLSSDCGKNEEKTNLINQIPTTEKPKIPRNPMESKKISLGKIIRRYKAKVKFMAGLNGYAQFVWQNRYYERVIRNEAELMKIREYIRNYVLKWNKDKNNPDNFPVC